VANVLAVLAEVQQHTIQLLLVVHMDCDAAESPQGCLMQPAVRPGSAEQAALTVSSTALQHCQQAGVWQVQ
jgi:hypothetical protein